MEILFEKYMNIQKFITDYRKYKLDGEFLDYNVFKKTIQIEQYIYHKCIDTIRGRLVYIYIFRENSKYIKTTQQFKRLIDKLPEEPADVIIISKNELNVYINHFTRIRTNNSISNSTTRNFRYRLNFNYLTQLTTNPYVLWIINRN